MSKTLLPFAFEDWELIKDVLLKAYDPEELGETDYRILDIIDTIEEGVSR